MLRRLITLFYYPNAVDCPLPVNPKPMDAYLVGGQSNATGQGYLASLPKEDIPDTALWIFHSVAPHPNSGSRLCQTWILPSYFVEITTISYE